MRTWAPKGQTPILQHHFNWSQLSVIAGITFRRFYFRLFPGAIKGPQIIEFLHALGQQIRQPLLVIWDGLAAHRSALVREYLEALNGAAIVRRISSSFSTRARSKLCNGRRRTAPARSERRRALRATSSARV